MDNRTKYTRHYGVIIFSVILNLAFLTTKAAGAPVTGNAYFPAAAISDRQHNDNMTVTGKVTDGRGEPIPGASIIVSGTNIGTITDSDGNYTLKNVPADAVLQISFIGYKRLEVAVEGRSRIDLTLEEDIRELDEIVVVGYGTVKKSHVTGSVGKLKNENLDEIPASRLDQAIIGKIAGVMVQNVNPEAGGAPTIRVRGVNSISATSDPLVVVDGYPLPDGMAFVNSQDVESIEVLKDAASAAIYGSRGANGVILITTKTGKSDKPRYSVKAYYGVKEPYALNPIMSFTEYANKLYAEAALRANDPSVSESQRNLINNSERASYVIENQISGRGTNWQEEAMQDAAIYNVQVGISGGRRDLRYYISGNLQQDQGIMKYSENDRANVRAKIDGTLSPKVTFSVNFNPSYTKTQRPAVNFTDYFRFYSFLPVYHTDFTAAYIHQNAQWASVLPGDFAQARHFNGLSYSGIMPDGTLWTSNGTVDPFSTANNTPLSIAARETRDVEIYRLLGGGDLSITLLPDLVFKTSLGGYMTYQEDRTLTKRNARRDGDVNQASIGTRKYIDLLWENTLNYTLVKGDHSFTGLLGYTAQKTTIEESDIVGRDFPTDDFETLNQAAQIDQSLTQTLKEPIGLISYLGRVTYDYRGKYLLSASFRTDGSSYFSKGNKYGLFPSVSAGWRMSDEPFLNNVTWLSNLKLRASYGATGNNRIQSFAYQNLLYPANYSLGAGTGGVLLGLAPNSDVLGNPSITWERTFEYNTGIDLGFRQDKYTLTVEYYNKVTDHLLFKESAMSYSGSNEYWNNSGKLRNRGIEVEIVTANIRSDKMEWTTALNFSANRNKLMELGGEPYQYNYGERNEVYAAIVGQPSIQFYGYKTDGVWTSQTQIDEAKANGQTSALARYFQAGGLRFVDRNGDNHIDIEDRMVLGTPFPDFIWGVTNAVKYRAFDVNILIQGSQGGKLVNGDAFYNESKRFNKNFNTTNRWVSAANPGDGKTPYLTNGEDWMLTDYVLEDASYVALRNIIIGYTLPRAAAKRAGLRSLRFYGSVDNLVYLMGSGYRGINPEARSTSSAYSSPLVDGYQRGSFPLTRTYTLGIDINF